MVRRHPILRDHAVHGFDAVFSEFNLDSDEVVPVPTAATHACQLIAGLDARRNDLFGLEPHLVTMHEDAERYFGARDLHALSGRHRPHAEGALRLDGILGSCVLQRSARRPHEPRRAREHRRRIREAVRARAARTASPQSDQARVVRS